MPRGHVMSAQNPANYRTLESRETCVSGKSKYQVSISLHQENHYQNLHGREVLLV